jgi:hypothetical protein
MDPQDTGTERSWNARRLRPVIAFYVVGVFAVFIALAHFVFHSPDAIKALAAAALAAVVSLVPSLLNRLEYRITDGGLQKRPLSKERPRAFEDVFAWDELSHLVPTRTGFKYYKKLDEPKPLARFYKLHLSADHSGELHVERRDLEKVRALLHRHAVPVLGSPGLAGGDGTSKGGDP